MKLRAYQEVAVSFLKGRNRAALLLDMGLGKSGCVLSALEPRHLPVLIVAPKRVAEETWPAEHALWRPDLSIALATGSPAQRKAALSSGADIVVLSRDNLGDVPDFRHKWNTLVLDESSGFKNYDTTRWRMANGLANRTRHVWLLSGTPAPNGYLDLWSQVFLLDGGARLGYNITAYRKEWFYPIRTNANHVVLEWGTQDGAQEQIKSLISDCCLYMESDGRVHLPEITYNPVEVTLPTKVMKFYRALKRDMVASLDDLGLTVAADNAGILSNQLSQVAAGFSYDTDRETGERTTTVLDSTRFEVIKELVEEIGKPVIVAYRYQEEERRLLSLPGARSIRSKGIVADWNAGRVPVLVAHPASAGHGLNLQHCPDSGHIIWSSPTWELELWQQMNKRLHRSGQKNPCVVHQVSAKGTVDSIVYTRLAGKEDVMQDLLDHLKSPI